MKNVLLDHPLSPDGTRPVMCIDEAQVMVFDICGEVCMMQVLDPWPREGEAGEEGGKEERPGR